MQKIDSDEKLAVTEVSSGVVEAMLSGEGRSKVISVQGELTGPLLVEDYAKIQDVKNRSEKLLRILSAWESQQTEERNLRKSYAKWLLIALFLQIILINIVFFFIGFGFMNVERWVATTFIIAVFSEISALLLVVVNYLFPKVGSELIKLLDKA